MTGNEVFRQQIKQWIDEFERGQLTKKSLYTGLEKFEQAIPQRQDLLYLQTSGTSLSSGVHGILLVENGQVSEIPSNPDDWPYQSVLEAIKDGWHVIQFPNMALLMDESRTYGLGCEFILEKRASGF
ncbi:hypothetical protein CMK22_10185 [Candidatus Poribacteria bacterium]|nr:hypothetical protein [Candidatus Poribacteria bacterium]